jgi:hypothetical protein
MCGKFTATLANDVHDFTLLGRHDGGNPEKRKIDVLWFAHDELSHEKTSPGSIFRYMED